MIVTFLAASRPHPVGGTTAVYHFANRLCRLGVEVHLVHFALSGPTLGPEQITWFSFEDGIEHHMPPETGYGPQHVPEADILFGFHEHFPARLGLPVTLIQGYGIFPEDVEKAAFRAPCPKICIAQWLVGIGRDLGVPEQEVVYVPYGIDHGKYRVTRPLAERPPRVSMLYNRHKKKGAVVGLAALEELKGRIPEVEVVLFGNAGPVHPIPPWMTFHVHPDQPFLVEEIYNSSRVFVCASHQEGFGFASVEAMACGAALVTTANGGSDDYAIHDRTALVSQAGDVAAMVDNLELLLVDEPRRRHLVEHGLEQVRWFDWDLSARRMLDFLDAYRADPGHYQRGGT